MTGLWHILVVLVIVLAPAALMTVGVYWPSRRGTHGPVARHRR